MKFIKREKSKENGVIYSVYNGSDLRPDDGVRCTVRLSYSTYDYDNNFVMYTDCYEDVPLSFAVSEIVHVRTVLGYDDLLAIVEPIRSE